MPSGMNMVFNLWLDDLIDFEEYQCLRDQMFAEDMGLSEFNVYTVDVM